MIKCTVDTDLPQPARRALARLRAVLRSTDDAHRERTIPDAEILVGIAGRSPAVDRALSDAGIPCPAAVESLVIHRPDRDRLIVAGRDGRGLAYALLEVARAVELSTAAHPLDAAIPAAESPELAWRSMQVFLCNRELEREWFYREGFWDGYLAHLMECRFNNLSLTFGHQTAYLSPPYPFLVEIPGFPQVRPLGFTSAERRQNLDMLRRISEMARAQGLHFTFAVWSQHAHSYGAPMVEGLGADILSDANAAGLRSVLEACPAIDGVQFRMNVESGIPEDRQAEFYEGQFRAISECGRPIRLDLRAKGLADDTIRLARELVPTVVISTKHWCEHLGMPYPMPAIQRADRGNYRRYGTWDLLEKPGHGPLVHRLWSAGTQRVLLWGDPEWVKRFVTSCHFGGTGFEIMAPLTNKGFQDEAGRWRVIPDPAHQPYSDEYARYWMFTLLFGRLGYNPNTSGEIWQRELRHRTPHTAEAVEQAYRAAGQVLPLITTVLQWSASIWRFWPEMFPGRTLEEDAHIEPSDPTQFYGIAEYVEDAVNGRHCGKWTPPQVAHHLRQLAAETRNALASFPGAGSRTENPELRGTALDFTLIAHLADYHACRLIAATHLTFYHRTGEAARLEEALRAMHRARSHWSSLSSAADGIYHSNLIFGRENARHCGHWKDLMDVVDRDIAHIERICSEASGKASTESVGRYPGEAPRPEYPDIAFDPVEAAVPGRNLSLRIRCPIPLRAVRCHHRIANQALPFDHIEMHADGDGGYVGTIPGESIDTRWDLMVFFEITRATDDAFRWPDWRVCTPYIVIPIPSPGDTKGSRNASASEPDPR